MPETDVMRNNPPASQGMGSPLHLAEGDSEAQLQPMTSSKEALLGISSAADVVVLCWNAPREPDRRAQEIAAFMGATVRYCSLTAALLERNASKSTIVPRCSCLIVEAETLAKIVDGRFAGVRELRGLLKSAAHVFVYGFQPKEAHDALLQALSSNRLVRTHSLSDADAKLHVAMDHPEWCFQFSGLCVGSADPARENSFVEVDSGDALPALIRIGSQPFFVRGESGASQLFFLAGGDLADLDENVTRHCSSLKWFCGLVPFMMFLRGALRDRVWHNDHPRACFIIDDPLLKRRHGFLEYKRLVESLRRQRFSACIAFIPWNSRRSSREIAALFKSKRDVLFLCIHGCDHTKAEFESADVGLLRRKAKLALERMRVHEQLSGLSFDDVMVFPQGLFSTEAMSALKAAGYLAAVNSELGPSTVSESLSIRDLLDVAVTRFSDFPLFGRRYPNDLAEFAFDLFMGKPALVVQHHDYFQDGHHALEAFVAGLNALDGRIEWTNLESICSRACLRRTISNGDVQVRFYTNRFRLENDTERRQNYELLYSLSSGQPVPSVTVDGRTWDSEREENHLKIRLSLNPGHTAEIRLSAVGKDTVISAASNTVAHEAGVRARRLLCEFRDNYVDTNPVLRRLLRGVK
jgi:hypothetical protein